MRLLLNAIDWLIYIIELAIFARILLSWIPISRDNPLVKLIYQLTEPILAPIRRLVEKSSIGSGMMFDFSPIIAILLIELVRRIIL